MSAHPAALRTWLKTPTIGRAAPCAPYRRMAAEAPLVEGLHPVAGIPPGVLRFPTRGGVRELRAVGLLQNCDAAWLQANRT